jgi:Right handed beta helix region
MGVVYDETSGVNYATLSAAISGSSANDVLLVPAGSYDENFPNITHNLTIDAVGGMASLTTPQPIPINDRAILNVPLDAGVSLTISGLEISGAMRAEPFPNGAGILFEQGNGILTVTNSYIHNNEDGILTGGPDAASPGGVMSVIIRNSQISGNGAPPGSSYASSGSDHNIYAGGLTSFTLTNSYITDEQGYGHEVKSRAMTNIITDNRIQDGPSALVSYDIDLPDGGNSLISGNVIEKGPGSVNENMINFGGDGTYPGSNLTITGNTFINDYAGGGIGLLNESQDPDSGDPNYNANVPATITGNTFYNLSQSNLFVDYYGPPPDNASNNVFLPGPGPALDTSPGYDVAEPASGAVLLFAVLSVAMIRGVGVRWPKRSLIGAT